MSLSESINILLDMSVLHDPNLHATKMLTPISAIPIFLWSPRLENVYPAPGIVGSDPKNHRILFHGS